MWWTLTALAGAAFFMVGQPDRSTATGGGATIGLIAGVVLALFYGNWWMIGRAIVIGILAGLVFELLPRLVKR